MKKESWKRYLFSWAAVGMMIAGLSTVTPAAGMSPDDDWSIIEADAEENTEQEISSAAEDDPVIDDDWAFSVIEESEPEAAEWQEIEEADALLPADETEFELLSAAGADTSGTCGDSVTWTLDSAGILTITGSGPMTDYSSNDESPFYGRSDIRSVVIEDGVETIGSYLFNRCRYLVSVQMPDSVERIGDYAFWWCTRLAEIDLSDSLTEIGSDAFCQCSALMQIRIPDGVKSIGESAFYNCMKLKSIELPDSLESIGSLAFGDCESLESIAIPKGVKAIERSTFNGCESLTQVVIPRSVESIGGYAFARCERLPEIRIPYGVKSIGMGAFQYCSSLIYIRIPSTVTSMGSSMFDFCSVLSDVYFGGSKEQWDSMAKNLNIQASAKIHYDCELRYTLDDGILVISKWTESELPFEGPEDAPWYEDKDQIRQVIVKGDQAGDIERIDDYAFQDCPQLRSVVLENSLPVIGSRAFEGDTVTVYQNGSLEASPYSIDAFSGVTGWIVWNYDNYDETAEEMVEETSEETAGETGTEASAGKGPHLVLSGMGKMEDMTDETALIAPWASGYKFAEESGSGEPLYEVTISDRITRLGSRTFRSVPDVMVVNVSAQIEECGSCLFTESDNYNGAYSGPEDSRVNIVFSGNAFDFPADAFYRSKLIAYAPPFNATWTEDRMQDYGGKVSWGKIKWEYESSDYVRYNEEGGWEDYAKGQKLLIRGDGPIPDYYDESELPWHPRNNVITEIEIRNGVTEIGDKAFMNLTAVSRVHVGPDIVRIGQDAFDRTGEDGNFFGGLQIAFSGSAPEEVAENAFGTDERKTAGSQGGEIFRLYPIDIYYQSDQAGWKALAERTWNNSYLAWIAGKPTQLITREEMWGFNDGQFPEYEGYYLSSEDEKRLLSHLSPIEKAAIKKDGKNLRYVADGIPKEGRSYVNDGGSCTGFSVTEALIYGGLAVPDFLQLPLGSFEKDHPREKVMSYINFYFLQQFLPSYQKYQADWINKDQAYQLALLETMVKAAQGSHEMVDISFQIEDSDKKRAGHTIMGYALEEGIFHVKMLGREYVFDHRILTYDPGEYANRHATLEDIRRDGKNTGNNYHTHAFYYSTGGAYDTCGMWMIPYGYMHLPCSTTNRIHGDDADDNARLLRVGSGYNYLNGVDYATGVVNYREGTVGEVIKTLLPDFDITLNDGTVYAVRNGRLDDTGDDTVVFNGIDNEGSSEEVCVVLKDGVEGYTITSDTGGCFSVYNPAAETMTTASLEKKGELSFTSSGEFSASAEEKGKIYVSITKNDIEREDGTAFLPEHTVSIEAGSVTAMTGKVTNIGFAVSTDSQCSTVIGAENLDTDEVERFRCEAGDHPFLITRSDEDPSRIAVKEDSDGDGDYETVIKGSYDSDTVAEEKITVSKKPSIKKPVAAKNKITVKWSHFRHTKKKAKAIWKKIKKVQVQCATDKEFTNIVKTAAVGKGRTKAVIKGLQKNTTYYLRVRYFDGTGYSKWSGVKKIRTKK